MTFSKSTIPNSFRPRLQRICVNASHESPSRLADRSNSLISLDLSAGQSAPHAEE